MSSSSSSSPSSLPVLAQAASGIFTFFIVGKILSPGFDLLDTNFIAVPDHHQLWRLFGLKNTRG
ncbi:hypothetical protein FB446DRAFT_796085 [Lentinula raphanica]|nr:hypothetical protein FB446DRAFT_796085 [Lentinula raphanica]